jgi:hypothetical protein
LEDAKYAARILMKNLLCYDNITSIIFK